MTRNLSFWRIQLRTSCWELCGIELLGYSQAVPGQSDMEQQRSAGLVPNGCLLSVPLSCDNSAWIVLLDSWSKLSWWGQNHPGSLGRAMTQAQLLRASHSPGHSCFQGWAYDCSLPKADRMPWDIFGEWNISEKNRIFPLKLKLEKI